MPTTTLLNICNRALSILGNGDSVSSLTSPASEAEYHCSIWIEPTFQEVIEPRDWAYRRRFSKLTRNTDLDYDEDTFPVYEYGFNMPSSLFITREVWDMDGGCRLAASEYDIILDGANSVLLAHIDNVGITYHDGTYLTSGSSTTTDMPLYMVDCVIKLLALKLHGKFGNSEIPYDDVEARYTRALALAIDRDSVHANIINTPSIDPWLQAGGFSPNNLPELQPPTSIHGAIEPADTEIG